MKRLFYAEGAVLLGLAIWCTLDGGRLPRIVLCAVTLVLWFYRVWRRNVA